MTKPERLEDLGRIRELITFLIDDLNENWGHYFDSKHSYDEFERLIKEKEDALYDLHFFMRNHSEKLWEIWAIAKGDEE